MCCRRREVTFSTNEQTIPRWFIQCKVRRGNSAIAFALPITAAYGKKTTPLPERPLQVACACENLSCAASMRAAKT
jgi:hypothetical protein